MAIYHEDVEIVKLLLQKPTINVNQSNEDNERPITIVNHGTKKSIDILKLLLKVPSLNLDFMSGDLHFSHEVCQAEEQDYVTLISKDPRFKINALNSDGETPIEVSARENDWNLFNILFKNPTVDKSVLSPVLITAMNLIHVNGLEVPTSTGGFKTRSIYPTREVNLNDDFERTFRIASEHFYRMKSGSQRIEYIEVVSNPSLEDKFNKKKQHFGNRGISNKGSYKYNVIHFWQFLDPNPHQLYGQSEEYTTIIFAGLKMTILIEVGVESGVYYHMQ